MAKLRHDKGLGVFSFVTVPDPADTRKTKLTFDVNQPLRTLCNATTGALLPFNLNASANQAGWYFTKKSEFTDAKKTKDFARLNRPDEIYLIVEGPQQRVPTAFTGWHPTGGFRPTFITPVSTGRVMVCPAVMILTRQVREIMACSP